MIVVTGATGRLGSQIVEHLLERIPAAELGVSVRDPARAGALAERGVRVRAGDFTEPDTLRYALEGADQVLVVSAAIRGDGGRANRVAVDAAVAAGAERVLYTSHQAAAADSLFAAQPVHAATESHLAGLGVPFTALRNGFYAGSLGLFVGDALTTGRLAAPADGPVSWTAHADLAEAAAIALADRSTLGGTGHGPTPPLTASRALDLADVARLLTEITGTEIVRVVVDDDDWRATAIAAGVPPGAADFTLGFHRAARRGEFDVTDPTLPRTLGREPLAARVALEALVAGR
ncbi:NAD(P)H-binding protein [Nocardioides lentus]|uniref:NAD(P)H-binding protein n=1 Tax=Nocardioides lentus TaxID=338077 RepID=A0ABN2PIU2_9ACTN